MPEGKLTLSSPVLVDKDDLKTLKLHFIAFKVIYEQIVGEGHWSTSELKIYLDHINTLLKKYGI